MQTSHFVGAYFRNCVVVCGTNTVRFTTLCNGSLGLLLPYSVLFVGQDYGSAFVYITHMYIYTVVFERNKTSYLTCSF